MSQAWITIITPDYLTNAIALRQSINAHGATLPFVVYCTGEPDPKARAVCLAQGIELIHTDSIDSEIGKKIREKYINQPDELRWSLKPVVMLEQLKKHQHVIYLDNDLFFGGNWSLYWEKLRRAGILLCPHWRIDDPETDADWFRTNFKDGLYNAGFVGASRAGSPALEWWASACLHACEKSPENGLWDDQRYLDLLPAHFSKVKILSHKGSNVAFWNSRSVKRSLKNGRVFLDDDYPLIFVHFTKELIELIANGDDPTLEGMMKKYQEALTNARLLLL